MVSLTPGNQVAEGSASSFAIPVPLPNSTSLAQAMGPVERGGECCGGSGVASCRLVVGVGVGVEVEVEVGMCCLRLGFGFDSRAGCGFSSGSVILSVHSSLSPSSPFLSSAGCCSID